MKISIITVTYNCASTIEKTLKSVVSQDYSDIEYVVIDGASTDGTKDIIEKYLDGITYYCSEKDGGIYDAMNKGIKNTTGDVVLFLNGDDSFIDNYVIGNIVNKFDNNPHAEIIIGKESINGRLSDKYDPDRDISLYVDVFFPHQATFAKKYLYEKIGGFDNTYRISADYDWILRAYSNGVSIMWVDDVVSVFKSGGRSASIECVTEEFLISKKYLNLVGDTNLYQLANEHYGKEFCDIFMWEQINNADYDVVVEEALALHINKGRRLTNWGAGINGKALCRFLRDNHLEVSCFYDSDISKFGQVINGVAVKEYCGADCYIIISSKDHEDEIARILSEKGLVEYNDFMRFSTFARTIVKSIFNRHAICKKFYMRTNLNVPEYIT